MIPANEDIMWRGNNVTDIGEYSICQSNNDKRNYFGSDCLIHENLKPSIIEFEPVSEKMCYMKLKGKFCNTSIIYIYSCSDRKKKDLTKDEFYGLELYINY